LQKYKPLLDAPVLLSTIELRSRSFLCRILPSFISTSAFYQTLYFTFKSCSQLLQPTLSSPIIPRSSPSKKIPKFIPMPTVLQPSLSTHRIRWQCDKCNSLNKLSEQRCPEPGCNSKKNHKRVMLKKNNKGGGSGSSKRRDSFDGSQFSVAGESSDGA
jgi:hypothetical protein